MGRPEPPPPRPEEAEDQEDQEEEAVAAARAPAKTPAPRVAGAYRHGTGCTHGVKRGAGVDGRAGTVEG